ncbi:MAG TPA: cbb3-type cytochrome c oxidase subunit I [Acidimicrobiales bacterium]
MTVTEAPGVVVETAADETEPTAPSGLAALVGSGDPRSVGKLFVGTSLLFLLVSGVTGVLVGFEQADTSSFDILSQDTYNQVFTLHAIAGLFLVVLPLLLGLATAVVPLQIGASTVAFPRSSAAAYWVFLVSGGVLLASFAVNGGPYGGDSEGVRLFVVSLIAVIGALCVATVSVVTTVIALRTPGMSLRRVPLFSWSMLIAGSVWLLTLPILAGILVLVYVDVTYGQQFLGGADGIYSHIRWVFWQPTVYAFAIPALGIIGDIVPVFAQTRHKRHMAAKVLIGVFGAVSFGAWAQLGVVVGGATPDPTPWTFEAPWIAASVLALVALLGLLGLWAGTLASGRPRPASPLLLALIAGTLVLVGVAAGFGTSLKSLEVDFTTWMTGQAYAVLIGAVAAGLAGVVFWSPKLYGALVPEGAGRLAAPLLLLGTVVVAVSYGVAGLLDQPQFPGDVSQLDDLDTIETLNLVAAIGGVVVVLGGLLVILGVLQAGLTRPGSLGDDPWDGHTLEWATSSPPPIGNFAGLPEISSEAPVYDARHRAALADTETFD